MQGAPPSTWQPSVSPGAEDRDVVTPITHLTFKLRQQGGKPKRGPATTPPRPNEHRPLVGKYRTLNRRMGKVRVA